MLEFPTNAACIGEELLASSTHGNVLFYLYEINSSLQDSVNGKSCMNFWSLCDVLWLCRKKEVTPRTAANEICLCHRNASNPGPSPDPESHIFLTLRRIWVTWAAGWSAHTQRAGQLHDL